MVHYILCPLDQITLLLRPSTTSDSTLTFPPYLVISCYYRHLTASVAGFSFSLMISLQSYSVSSALSDTGTFPSQASRKLSRLQPVEVGDHAGQGPRTGEF
jgi:hypothetical protein